jgi:hypothetical protein
MKNKLIVVLVALLVLVLTGCKGPVTAGTVVKKDFVAAHDWTTQDPTYVTIPVTKSRTSCTGSGKTKSCYSSSYTDYVRTFVGWHTSYHHAGDKWTLTLKDSEGDTGVVEVDVLAYNHMEIGSQYGTAGT